MNAIDPKVIAFYLPQFHRIPENDEWWGLGFTEWTNTKKANPLFRGHYQPREPYHDNYYDLTDASTKKWQADIAKKYGVYGFCYYHYWFSGKQLLEKPAQQILESGEPDFPFCFSWANEPWTRNWDGMDNQVLMPQSYGGPEEWEEHFNYLYPFLADDRYIRIDEKPIFLIYRPANIPNCSDMLKHWRHMALAKGLPGIYFIETLSGFTFMDKVAHFGFDAGVEFEPMYTIRNYDVRRARRQVMSFSRRQKFYYDYNDVVKKIVKRDLRSLHRRNQERGTAKSFLGAFVDWDNTARRKEHALIFHGSTPERFGGFVKSQLERSRVLHNPFLFINAWNEWAEGTYLEPDKRYGYGYLEALQLAINQVGIKL